MIRTLTIINIVYSKSLTRSGVVVFQSNFFLLQSAILLI